MFVAWLKGESSDEVWDLGTLTKITLKGKGIINS